MDVKRRFGTEFAEHIAVARDTEATLLGGMTSLVAVCVYAIKGGGKLLLFGNGGSAADAQHIATELTIRYKADRSAIAAIALTTDTSALTAAGNDLDFDLVFSRQIEALGRPGDIAIAISTSSRSPNIIKALEAAKKLSITTAAVGDKDGGEMIGLADHLLIVPSNTTARIQEMHIVLGHFLCGALEAELGLVK